MRKAKGLSESCNGEVSGMGHALLAHLTTLQDAIYGARAAEQASIASNHQATVENLKVMCEGQRDSKHDKLKAFAREMLNDWDVIMRQTREVKLPLTNNEAERSLRHWVIDRRLSYGTRTVEGTRAFSILASVIDTCNARCVSAWNFLTDVISAARLGLELPALPSFTVMPAELSEAVNTS